MKYIYTLFLAIFLASCTSGNVENNEELLDSPITEITNNELENEIENLFEENQSENVEFEVGENVVKLNAAYRNPAAEVDMVVSFSTENGLINFISAEATTFDISSFNQGLQSLVGKTLDDAENFHLAGSSIASEAFTFALKNN